MYQHCNLPAHQLTTSLTQKHQRINLPTHQFTNLPAHQLTNSQAYQLTTSPTQKHQDCNHVQHKPLPTNHQAPMHGRFQEHTQQHQADKHSKGFGCHSLPISMVYAQPTHCNSLRTLEQSFNAHSHHHYHLNVRRRIRRSTLAKSLAKRDNRPFTDMLRQLMHTCSRTLRKQTQDTADLL